MSSLENKVAIVTGGTSGIGRATSLELARAGARVAVIGRDSQRVQATLAELNAQCDSDTHIGLSLDVRIESDMSAMAERVHAAYGRIDILVNSAGSGGTLAAQRRLPFAVVQTPLSEWEEVIDTNLKGVFLATHAVLPILIHQGGGEILNVSSSRGATKGLPYAAAYSSSKRALMGLTESLAEEMLEYGIRVHAILPDVTETRMLHVTGDIAPQGLMSPDDVARFIVRLVSLPEDLVLVDTLLAPFRIGEGAAA
ncbi:MAG: SDR family oxidoreductase [Planctomycetota bacterium]